MKKFLILILIIGGIFMVTYGFCENKCKHEVYTKDEVYKKSQVYTKDEVNNKINKVQIQSFSLSDEDVNYYLTFRRSGNVVNADITILIPAARSAYSGVIALDDYIPDFAKPTFHTYNTFKFASSLEVGSLEMRTEDTRIGFSLCSKLSLLKRNKDKHDSAYVMAVTLLTNNTEMDEKIIHNLTYIIDDEDDSNFQLGDVNLDGVIDEKDTELIKDYIMDYRTFNNKQFKAADMNSDGEIKSTDYVCLLNTIASQYQLGDINMDGVIDQKDSELLQSYVSDPESVVLSPVQKILADLNKDGNINTGDTLLMAKYLNGEINSFE